MTKQQQQAKRPNRPTSRQMFDNLYPNFDKIRWSVACRNMQIRVAQGNFNAAIRVLQEFCRDTHPSYATLDSLVTDVFSVRVANMLIGAGFSTIRSVDRAENGTLMAIDCFSDVSLEIVRRTIRSVKAGRVPTIPADEASLIDEEHFHSPEHRMYMYVLENGPQSPKALSKVLDMTLLQLKDAFERSTRLRKIAGRIEAK